MANIERGFIMGFNCCSDGRKLNKKIDGSYENLDKVHIGNMSWHPFLIVSATEKNNAPYTNYISAIPLTTSNSSYNQENGIPLTKDMLSNGGSTLLSRNSIIKTDKIVSINKKDYGSMGYMGEINPSTIPYKQILSKVIKSFGCNEIIQ